MSRKIERQFFLDLGTSGLRMPIGTDLVLREKPDAESILLDGRRLGEVFCEAARRYRTPLALPLMDLAIEKESMLRWLGVAGDDAPKFHFDAPPGEELLERIEERTGESLGPRLSAQAEAIRYTAAQSEFVPIGLTIGPFSLMTKLITDPIVPVYLAGTGLSGGDDPDILTVERCLELAVRTVLRSARQQIEAGARMMVIAEPAANQIYVSPQQIADGSDIFERFVMANLRRVKRLLDDYGAHLFFHCCGEITTDMLRAFCSLDPAILSLGSSRRLWEDAAVVPAGTVLFGNLPSKKFFSDREITTEQVRDLSRELLQRMSATGHAFILGSECDVLSVAGCEEPIHRKVSAMMGCGRE